MAKKILIVEDEKDPKRYLELLFTENGYETATAADGREALAIIKSFKPDLVTLDILMPEQSGIKFYREMKKNPELSKVPVIIISAATRYKDLFGRDHATMPKPYAFIEKPINKEDLLAKIGEAIG
jgi:CheY-like chemotaxis protein